MIKLWNLDTNECLRTFTGHEGSVYSLEISSDKSKLYSGSYDDTLRVWDISSGKCLKTIDLRDANCIKLLSSNFIAVGLNVRNENLKIIDLKSHEIVKSIKTLSMETVFTLNFDSEKNVLFSSYSRRGEIKMWQF
jgi:WD40 repeat protein